MANLKKLQKAGIVPTKHELSPKDVKVIESLSPDEVDTLIRLKEKLGGEFIERNIPSPKCAF